MSITNNAIGLSSAGIAVYNGAGLFTSIPYTAGSISNGSILALDSSGQMAGYSLTSGQVLSYNATTSALQAYNLTSNLAAISANDSTQDIEITFITAAVSDLQAGSTTAVVTGSSFLSAYNNTYPLNGIPVGAGPSGSSIFTWTTPTTPSAGSAAVLLYNTSGSITEWGTISAGTGLTLAQTTNSVTLSLTSSTGGFSFVSIITVPGSATTLAGNTIYLFDPIALASASGNVAFTLPTSCTVGQAFRIVGSAAPPTWTISGTATQTFYIGQDVYSSIASTLSSDAITIVCVSSGASQAFTVIDVMGNPTFTN